MPYDPSKPYLTGDVIDGQRIAYVRWRLDAVGYRHELTDDQILHGLRAIQDAAVHLGGNISAADSFCDILTATGPLSTAPGQ